MKTTSSAPRLNNNVYRNSSTTATSTVSLPLRHSSKPKVQVCAGFEEPTSHCQIEALPLTARHLQDLENYHQYHLLYDLIGSRFYSSCPELVVKFETNEKLDNDSRATPFYQVKSRSSYQVRAPEGRPSSQASRIAHKILSYVSACFGIPSCFREEKGQHGRSDL